MVFIYMFKGYKDRVDYNIRFVLFWNSEIKSYINWSRRKRNYFYMFDGIWL